MNPQLASEADPAETFIPVQIDLANGRLTAAGHWRKRPGYAPERRLPVTEPITALIPEGAGFVTTRSGKIFRFDATDIGLSDLDLATVQRAIDGWLTGPTGAAVQRIRADITALMATIQELIGRVQFLIVSATPVAGSDISHLVLARQALATINAELVQLAMTVGIPIPLDLELVDTAGMLLQAVQEHLMTALGLGQPPAASDLVRLLTTQQVLRTLSAQVGAEFTASHSTEIHQLIADLQQPLCRPVSGATLSGVHRPTWANYAGTLILANGGTVLAIAPEASAAAPLAGTPPAARFVVTLDGYVVLAGFNATEFRWSKAGSMTVFPPENFNAIQSRGEEIKMLRELHQTLHFFTSRTIEQWVDVGGQSVWARQRTIEKGTPAGDSVVRANLAFFFLGDDGEFYLLEGGTVQVISAGNRARVATLNHPEEVYGFDFPHEKVIRWFAPSEGRVFVWDYVHQLFSEDFAWQAGPQMMPIGAFMRLGNTDWIGDGDRGGTISRWTQAVHSDAGREIRVTRSFRVPLAANGRGASVNLLRLRVKRGEHLDAPGIPAQAERPRALVRWRFDEEDWTPTSELDLGAVGERNPFVEIARLGRGSEIVLELVETDAVDFLVTQAFLTVEAGR